jgi:light-regulated signal transduction histidine kinase (bacteriophytochrome)
MTDPSKKNRDKIANLELQVEILERLVEDRTRELYLSNEKLNQINEKLMRTNVSELEQFVHIASHDLQAPARTITNCAELLKRSLGEKLDDQSAAYIGLLIEGGKSMQALIKDLLHYSRVRGTEWSPSAVNTMEVISRVVAESRQLIKQREAQVNYSGLPTVRGDETLLFHLFQNLIANGIKFNISTRPQITIAAKRNGMEWIFTIDDNGIGIDLQYRERIFEMFQRLHAKGEYEGTGMGLAICKKVVERHEGRIWVDSERDRGSTFYIALPA